MSHSTGSGSSFWDEFVGRHDNQAEMLSEGPFPFAWPRPRSGPCTAATCAGKQLPAAADVQEDWVQQDGSTWAGRFVSCHHPIPVSARQRVGTGMVVARTFLHFLDSAGGHSQCQLLRLSAGRGMQCCSALLIRKLARRETKTTASCLGLVLVHSSSCNVCMVS